jgi:hypothetical protein
VRYSNNEYCDTLALDNTGPNNLFDLPTEVLKHVNYFLDSNVAKKCREKENLLQYQRLYKGLIKSIRNFKIYNTGKIPNMCHLLSHMLNHEKKINIIYPISNTLKQQCYQNILRCIIDLKNKGFKCSNGNKLQELVCGLLFLLRTGVTYTKYELLPAIPEVRRCIPMESRLKIYFNIDSKIVTSIENEIKFVFRDFHQ